MITGNGSPCWAKGATPAVSHASPVARLLDAGATLVGKAHMDELAFSVGGENAHYGTLDNPIAPGRTVGGSEFGLGGGSRERPVRLCPGHRHVGLGARARRPLRPLRPSHVARGDRYVTSMCARAVF